MGCAFKALHQCRHGLAGALLASAGVTVPPGNGFIAESVEESLHNLGRICKEGMAGVDRAIISIMEKIPPAKGYLAKRNKRRGEQLRNEPGCIQG